MYTLHAGFIFFMTDPTTVQERQVRAFFIAALVIAALLVLLIAVYFFGQHLLVGNKNDTTNNAGVAVVANPRTPQEYEAVFSRTGTITNLHGSTLILRAVLYDSESSAYISTDLTVTMNSSTVYSEEDRTKPISPPVPGQAAQQYPVKNTSRDTLTVGSIATVFSKSDMRGLRDFTASEVRTILGTTASTL